MRNTSELDCIIESFKSEKKIGCIIEGSEKEFNEILFPAIYENQIGNIGASKKIERIQSFEIDPDNLTFDFEKPILVLFPICYRTISQLETEKRIIAIIEKNYKKYLLLRPVDHPLLSHTSLIYPDEIFSNLLGEKLPKNDSKKKIQYFIPKNPYEFERPIKASLRKIGATEWEKNLFKIVITCLYPPHQYQQIQRLKNFKNTVFLVKVKLKDENFSSRYEVVKIDSIHKTNQEKDNFDIIHGNRTGQYVYHIRNSMIFPGEFIGAIRSCTESSFDLKKFELITLRESFQEKSKMCSLNGEPPNNYLNILVQLDECLESIYNLGHRNHSEPAFPVYRKTILPEIMDIFIPWGLKNISLADDKQEISKIKADFLAIELMPGELMPIEKSKESKESKDSEDSEKNCCYLKLLEIMPDITEKSRCFILFEAKDTNGNAFRIKCPYSFSGWREAFNSYGLAEGKMVKISNRVEAAGYFFKLFMWIKKFNLVSGISETDKQTLYYRKTEINNIRNSQEKEVGTIKKFLTQPTLTLNKGSRLPLKKVWNPLYLLNRFNEETDLLLKEVTGPAHGDLNLDNILIYLKDKEKCNPETETRLIDLASFATDYPLSFDYVKLEVELKNHIFANTLFEKLKVEKLGKKSTALNKKNPRQRAESRFINLVFRFEKALWDCDEFEEILEDVSEKPEVILLLSTYFPIIKRIREDGQKRYENNSDDAAILYQQQLFFYSIRTITYQSITDRARLWAFMAAITAADNLDLD